MGNGGMLTLESWHFGVPTDRLATTWLPTFKHG
jgi:hypothetical protein